MKAKKMNAKILSNVLDQLKAQGVSLGVSEFMSMELNLTSNNEFVVSVQSKKLLFVLTKPVSTT